MDTVVVYEAVGCSKSDWASCRYKVKHLGAEVARFNANEEYLSMLRQICKAKDGNNHSTSAVNLTTLNGSEISDVSVDDITLSGADTPSYIAVRYFKDSGITPENIFEME